MDIEMLSRQSKGWARSWSEIRRVFGDFACEDPTSGESWQYMGSTDQAHEFRHRQLPQVAVDHCRTIAEGDVSRWLRPYPDGHGVRAYWQVARLEGDGEVAS